jgi:hypothetical protein
MSVLAEIVLDCLKHSNARCIWKDKAVVINKANIAIEVEKTRTY